MARAREPREQREPREPRETRPAGGAGRRTAAPAPAPAPAHWTAQRSSYEGWYGCWDMERYQK